MGEIIKNRYDFVVLFDVENGNPNGDPDAGNMPRIDMETNCGIVTDVCLKRKIRNYVEAVKEGEEGYRIYIKENVPLNRSDAEAYQSLNADPKKIKEEKKKTEDFDLKVRDYMCENFFDIRTFGAVMTTFVKDNLNCGQVRGPVQLSFAKSVDPVIPQEITITRVAITTETMVAGCATCASQFVSIESAARFAVETAKFYGAGKCRFYDEEQFQMLQKLYGSMAHLKTEGKKEL